MTAVAETQNTMVRYIRELDRQGGLSRTDIANITEVSRSTASRWANGVMTPRPDEQLFLSDLHYIVGRLEEYYTRKEVRTWLYAPHQQLDGERAIDVIAKRESARVIAILDRLDADSYL